MQEIIAHIEKVLHYADPFEECSFKEMLDRDSPLHWKSDFPVTLIHRIERAGEAERSFMQEERLVDALGYTKERYDAQTIEKIARTFPLLTKRVSSLCSEKSQDYYRYRPKYPSDKWKKILDEGGFKAVLELSVFKEGATVCEAERKLRNLMRSSKEVPSLKHIAFVWVAVVPESCMLERVIEHYFGSCYLSFTEGSRRFYIAWAEMLGEVRMRTFVCPPKS